MPLCAYQKKCIVKKLPLQSEKHKCPACEKAIHTVYGICDDDQPFNRSNWSTLISSSRI